MKSDPPANLSKSLPTIRFYLADGSVHTFIQPDDGTGNELWAAIEPSRVFIQPRIVVGSEHSKSVFVTAEIVRVDFLHASFERWEFPHGYSDIVELTEEEFREHAKLNDLSRMVKRDNVTLPGDPLVSFIKLQMRGGLPLFVMVEAAAKLPAESQSFMHFLLSKASVHMRLRGGGIGVVNLSNLASYTVYPGVAQLPADAWLAEPVAERNGRAG